MSNQTTIAQRDADLILGRLTPTMAATIPAAPDPLDELRRHTLRTLLQLADQHRLPIPLQINGHEHTGIGRTINVLDLAFELPDQVDAWARVLGLGPVEEFAEYRQAGRFGLPGEPVWLGWHHLYARFYECHRRAVTT